MGESRSTASGTDSEAFFWTSGSGMVGLGDLPGGSFDSYAIALADDVPTVVGFGNSASGQEAFHWTPGTGMVGLGDLAGGAFSSVAHGVSADGSTVVGASESASGTEAFIWDATNGMRELDAVLSNLGLGLDLTGWTLDYAHKVSADGTTIVGEGVNPEGYTEAWIATIPEPGTGLLLGIGLVGLAIRSRRSS